MSTVSAGLAAPRLVVPVGIGPPPAPNEAPAPFGPRSEFTTLGAAVQAALVRIGTRRRFEPNAFIYLQDDDAEGLYFVRSGHVRISHLLEDGSAVLHAILPPGDSFGELGVFENGTQAEMATAVGATSVLFVPAAAFRSLAAGHPELNVALGRVVARRYRSYIMLTRDLSLKTLPARLAQAVLRLADALGSTTEVSGRAVACVGPVVNQTDLGLMARGSRGNVNRALKAWERSGWIDMTDRRIAILRRDRLEALSIEDDLP